MNINYKKVRVVLKHQFEWMKFEWLLLLSLNIFFGVLFSFFSFKLSFVIIVALLYFSFTMSKETAIEGFNWKFYQTLTLNKRELIAVQTFSLIFSSIPGVVWVISFWGPFNRLMEFNTPKILILLNLIFFLLYLGAYTSLGQVEKPRAEFVKLDPYKKFIRFLRMFVLFISIPFYFVFISEVMEFKKILMALSFFVETFAIFMIPFSIICAAYYYRKTLRVWADEKLTYNKLQWQPKREYGILAAIVVPTSLLFLAIYGLLSGHEKGNLQSAVSEKNYSQIKDILQKGSDVNFPNEYGVTPMMVALRHGDLQMIKFLEENGANYEGVVTKKDHKFNGYNAIMFAIASEKVDVLKYIESKVPSFTKKNNETGMYPIHLASSRCQPKMVDYFIEQGADVEVQNSKGETPMVVAAKSKCFPVVVALKEAGANIASLEKLSTKDVNQDIAYFIEKSSRTPASVSNK